MPTKDAIIRENHELRARLELAQIWMRREVAISMNRIQEEQSQRNTRVAMKNIFETEGLDIFTRKIIQIFGISLEQAPRYTLERLVDAEIYWNTLQQYPQMDALPIIIAYQKIFDAWIEERLVASWRTKNTGKRLGKSESSGEKDIINLIDKKYTLSLGRLYQILQSARNNEIFGRFTGEFIEYIRSEGILDILLSDEFFLQFESLIEGEIFSRKRHESKVTYSDARFTRNILIGTSEKRGLFELIFLSILPSGLE